MKYLPLIITAVSTAVAGPALSAAPKVATDIPPVHSLVAQVMGDLGTPELVMRPGSSPHGYSMRPSEAGLLESADLVIWVGPELTPWLERARESLAPDTPSLELIHAPGIKLLEFREGAEFEHHDHHNEHADHDEHDDDHDEHADHDDHDEHAKEDGDEHEHGSTDPHIWLDPANAKTAVNLIAEELAEIDPENAATYRRNAEAALARLDGLDLWITESLADNRGKAFIVFHDAYHYYEAHFDFEAAGAISIGDASAPSPRRVDEVRQVIEKLNAECVFAEPQFDPKIIDVLTEGKGTRRGTLDPLGTSIDPGPAQYDQLMRDLTNNLVACLSPEA